VASSKASWHCLVAAHPPGVQDHAGPSPCASATTRCRGRRDHPRRREIRERSRRQVSTVGARRGPEYPERHPGTRVDAIDLRAPTSITSRAGSASWTVSSRSRPRRGGRLRLEHYWRVPRTPLRSRGGGCDRGRRAKPRLGTAVSSRGGARRRSTWRPSAHRDDLRPVA